MFRQQELMDGCMFEMRHQGYLERDTEMPTQDGDNVAICLKSYSCPDAAVWAVESSAKLCP